MSSLTDTQKTSLGSVRHSVLLSRKYWNLHTQLPVHSRLPVESLPAVGCSFVTVTMIVRGRRKAAVPSALVSQVIGRETITGIASSVFHADRMHKAPMLRLWLLTVFGYGVWDGRDEAAYLAVIFRSEGQGR